MRESGLQGDLVVAIAHRDYRFSSDVPLVVSKDRVEIVRSEDCRQDAEPRAGRQLRLAMLGVLREALANSCSGTAWRTGVPRRTRLGDGEVLASERALRPSGHPIAHRVWHVVAVVRGDGSGMA